MKWGVEAECGNDRELLRLNPHGGVVVKLGWVIEPT